MLFPSWWKLWKSGRGVRRNAHAGRRSYRPKVEGLEDRRLLSVFVEDLQLDSDLSMPGYGDPAIFSHSAAADSIKGFLGSCASPPPAYPDYQLGLFAGADTDIITFGPGAGTVHSVTVLASEYSAEGLITFHGTGGSLSIHSTPGLACNLVEASSSTDIDPDPVVTTPLGQILSVELFSLEGWFDDLTIDSTLPPALPTLTVQVDPAGRRARHKSVGRPSAQLGPLGPAA